MTNQKTATESQRPNADRLMDVSFACVYVLPRLLLSRYRPVVTRATTSEQLALQFAFPGGESVYLQTDRRNISVFQQGWMQLDFGSMLTVTLERKLRQQQALPQEMLDEYFQGLIYGPTRFVMIPADHQAVKLLEILDKNSPLMVIAGFLTYDIRVSDGEDMYPLIQPIIEGLRERTKDYECTSDFG